MPSPVSRRAVADRLREQRSTELAEIFPGHVAAAWLGHTEEIADAHYRQVLPSHFEKATQNLMQSGTKMSEWTGRPVSRPLSENEKAPECPGLSAPCRMVQGMPIGGGGRRVPQPTIEQQ